MRKWVLVIILLLVAMSVAFGIFAFTGVIDGPALFWDLGMKVGWIEPHLKVYAVGQDAESWVAVQQEELQRQMAELDAREAKLRTDQQQLDQRAVQLDAREASINEAFARLQREQEQHRNIQTLASLYTEMTAADAAQILEKLDQKLVLDVLLSMDMQDAASILVELPTNLAVALSEQLGQASK
ncbi:MAG TPA: hypothetical protein DDZ66_12960 [Firmicutes bacterium]|nr:hypothetical protein [Bacillota bacterium]